MENNEEQFLKIDDEILFLSQFVPGALAEGSCQFFFKEFKNDSWILTLNEQQCKLEEQPLGMDPGFGCWAWDLMNNCWKFIQYTEIDSFNSWPPKD
jgi:hypothetical protein